MNNRLMNIELLRNIAMLEIVIIHMFIKSSILENMQTSQPIYYFVWILYAIVLTGNNLFMLITGYFMCESRFRLSKVLNIYTLVLAYSVVFAIIAKYVLDIDLSGGWRAALFPIVHRSYWFATVYLVMLILSPFINSFIKNVKRTEFKRFLIMGGVLFSIIPVFFSDWLNIGGGYGVVYFSYMYMLGAYLRKYVEDVRLVKTKYILCILVLPIIRFCVLNLEDALQNRVITTVYKHAFPTVILSSVYLFMIFLRIDVVSDKTKKIINWFSTSTFAVYLVHNNNNISHYLWDKTKVLDWTVNKQNPIVVLLIGILVFVLCVLLDKVRIVIWRGLRVDKLLIRVSNSFENEFHIDEKMCFNIDKAEKD